MPSRPRRLARQRVVFFLLGLLLCVLYALTLKVRRADHRVSVPSALGDGDKVKVNVREVVEELPESTVPPIEVNRTDIEQCVYVEAGPLPTPPVTVTPPPSKPSQKQGEYPEDLFSVEKRRRGWVVLHVVGMTYMFVALAIVCDEFFVPALEVITNRLEISDDVAGATFMAAGGSAPELFTSLIGVFISHSNVGIGTIVGSAVFNILFVIGMCAIFSREILHLTWWPLFRDVTFYIVDLFMLIVFFLDNMIHWWESAMLVLGYISYVSFMKFNGRIERAAKSQLNKHMSVVKVWSAAEPEKEREATPPSGPLAPPSLGSKQHSREEPDQPLNPQVIRPPGPHEDKTRPKVHPVLQRGGSSASLHNTSLRNTIFQLMIHTLDPLGEDTVLKGSVRNPGLGRSFQETSFNGDVRGDGSVRRSDDDDKLKSESCAAGAPGCGAAEPSTSQQPHGNEPQEKSKAEGLRSDVSQTSTEEESGVGEASDGEESDDDNGKEEEEEENEPLSLEWPETKRKQATYLFLLPIVFPLWLTLPDVRNPESRRYFVVTFLGSILWIAVFSYLMVWWAHQIGETIGISEEIMGLTILAAGTSIPDLITSVIVARKGLGDMAVSSSVGSNIFDITIGLPVPWLIFTLLHRGAPVAVSSNGLFCAIVLLFLMLLFVIISIAVCRWKMSRKLGFTMFALYFVFLVLSVMLEDRILICPVSI
ncbi:sodium/potassium/calcium exchanger 1-like isoform X1 [Synchiropus splendidus]|uniref:sodium/potassium/calcium exchanger 1-like isoform X1 n=1 Tax=Synchiropus splendidus TaxID=270530 RepID=UPI00237DD42F|nr:sodium/potassium/calcium exchanger 1-like isoform X1 [Synchiropus splendidus]